MTIKHLVISGGGPSMIQMIGCIQHLEENKYLDCKAIETIYGTSSGAIVATLMCLQFDWETINDYIIKRPWHEVFPINIQSIFDAYTKRGVFDIKTIEKCFKPLLAAKDLPIMVTLKELYDFSKIELHFITFEINNFKAEDISYLTNPDLPLLQAIQMTCGIPILVSPVCIDGKCYIDGGVVCNYPLKYCLDAGKKEDEILSFKNQFDNTSKNQVNLESTLLDFILCFLFNVMYSLSTDHAQPKIQNEVECHTNSLSIDVFRTAIYSVDARKQLFQNGADFGKQFLLQNSI